MKLLKFVFRAEPSIKYCFQIKLFYYFLHVQDQFVVMPKNQRIFRVIDEDDYIMPGYVVSIFKTIFTPTY